MSKGQWSLLGDILGPGLFWFVITLIFVFIASVPGCGLNKVQQSIDVQLDEVPQLQADHNLVAMIQHPVEINGESKTIGEWLVQLQAADDEDIREAMVKEIRNIMPSDYCAVLKAGKPEEKRYFKEEINRCKDMVKYESFVTIPLRTAQEGVIEVELEELR